MDPQDQIWRTSWVTSLTRHRFCWDAIGNVLTVTGVSSTYLNLTIPMVDNSFRHHCRYAPEYKTASAMYVISLFVWRRHFWQAWSMARENISSSISLPLREANISSKKSSVGNYWGATALLPKHNGEKKGKEERCHFSSVICLSSITPLRSWLFFNCHTSSVLYSSSEEKCKWQHSPSGCASGPQIRSLEGLWWRFGSVQYIFLESRQRCPCLHKSPDHHLYRCAKNLRRWDRHIKEVPIAATEWPRAVVLY